MKRKREIDQGSTRLKYFLGFVPDALIRKMKMGLENVVVCITEMTKAFIMSLILRFDSLLERTEMDHSWSLEMDPQDLKTKLIFSVI